MTRTLVVGASGYIGRGLVDLLTQSGRVAEGSSRRAGAAQHTIADADALGRIAGGYAQVVVTAQLTARGVDWLIDQVDGPRWLVFSSAQLDSPVPAPGSELALAREEVVLRRGGTVIRPTMVFGRGGDQNVSRLIRHLRRWRVPLQIGDGHQLVQPLHVEDLAAIVTIHAARQEAGLFQVGGDEAVPAAELLLMLVEILGLRFPTVSIPATVLRSVSSLIPAVGLRDDQVRRLEEDKTVDLSSVATAFDWWPAPLANRLEQAVIEVDP